MCDRDVAATRDYWDPGVDQSVTIDHVLEQRREVPLLLRKRPTIAVHDCRQGGDRYRYDAFIEALGQRLTKGPKVRQKTGEDVTLQDEGGRLRCSRSTPDYADRNALINRGFFCLS